MRLSVFESSLASFSHLSRSGAISDSSICLNALALLVSAIAMMNISFLSMFIFQVVYSLLGLNVGAGTAYSEGFYGFAPEPA